MKHGMNQGFIRALSSSAPYPSTRAWATTRPRNPPSRTPGRARCSWAWAVGCSPSAAPGCRYPRPPHHRRPVVAWHGGLQSGGLGGGEGPGIKAFASATPYFPCPTAPHMPIAMLPSIKRISFFRFLMSPHHHPASPGTYRQGDPSGRRTPLRAAWRPPSAPARSIKYQNRPPPSLNQMVCMQHQVILCASVTASEKTQ
jgi:hypothetical protein